MNENRKGNVHGSGLEIFAADFVTRSSFDTAREQVYSPFRSKPWKARARKSA